MNSHPGRVPANHARDDVNRVSVVRYYEPPQEPPRQARVVPQVPLERELAPWVYEHLSESSPSPWSRLFLRLIKRFGSRPVIASLVLLGTAFVLTVFALASNFVVIKLLVWVFGIFWLLAIGTHPLISIARTFRNATGEMFDDD
jgi:hypothetical protein